ncbi:hypothetical protein L596_022235 [Steinernema carpocapsae]|uniref:Uncharacterized protein n=1 Tax=Steinernema carpocapsae TaxID=34508 RepID=A0A4U5ML57_STECR|nr:hypothetical protein L596_022235 [Steinernema carpocapsae]
MEELANVIIDELHAFVLRRSSKMRCQDLFGQTTRRKPLSISKISAVPTHENSPNIAINLHSLRKHCEKRSSSQPLLTINDLSNLCVLLSTKRYLCGTTFVYIPWQTLRTSL